MENESFENSEIAEFLNGHFVSIKVDREERPDIDSVYMNVCQMMTGNGGWPLSVFMTPGQKPFFTGTYFPPYRKYGHMGFMELLIKIEQLWASNKDEIVKSGDEIISGMTDVNQRENKFNKNNDLNDINDLWIKIPEKAYAYFSRNYDSEYGGFGREPKFPSPHNLMFLLKYNKAKALEMVENTVLCMYKGGIFDHIGYGFSRYSTDRKWLAPHFEKMLYDNALMVIVICELYQITKNPVYESIVKKVLTYIKREMTSPEGGFYCAQDADIDGEEGKFYTFSYNEIIDILDEGDGLKFCEFFDITKDGNFEGMNIPNLIKNEYFSNEYENEGVLKKMYEYRKNRYQLHKDDKMLTSWNAMMIIAFTKAYKTFNETGYLDAAQKAAGFVETKLTSNNDDLFISYRNGMASGKGLLDDYAYMAWAYIELYNVTFDIIYIKKSIDHINKIIHKFSDIDKNDGRVHGYFLNPNDGEQLILRPKEQYDGAVPSGNSVMAYCLDELYSITGDEKWNDLSDGQMTFYYENLLGQPYAHTFALIALIGKIYPAGKVICLIKEHEDVEKFRSELYKYNLSDYSFILKTLKNENEIDELMPMLKNYKFNNDHKYTFYLCRGNSCMKPVYNFNDLFKLLSGHE